MEFLLLDIFFLVVGHVIVGRKLFMSLKETMLLCRQPFRHFLF